MPGHKKLLISLPDKLHSFKNKKCRKNFFSTPRNVSQENLLEEAREDVVELLTDDEISALKDKLVTKINFRAQLIGIKELFTRNNIVSEIETYISHSRYQNKLAYKCSVKCVLCEMFKPCTHVTYWQISNLEKHLREHSNNNKSETSNSHTNNTAKSSNQNELDDVLRSESENES